MLEPIRFPWSERTDEEYLAIKAQLQAGIEAHQHPKKIVYAIQKSIPLANTSAEELALIVQTEWWQSVNDAHRKSNERMASNYSQLELHHIWRSKCNVDTCDDCLRLDRKSLPVGEPFVHPTTGKKVYGPPLHQGCECRLQTWSPGWARTPVAAALDPRVVSTQAGAVSDRLEEPRPSIAEPKAQQQGNPDDIGSSECPDCGTMLYVTRALVETVGRLTCAGCGASFKLTSE